MILASLLITSSSSLGYLPFHLPQGCYLSLDPSLVMPLHQRLHIMAFCHLYVFTSFHMVSDLTCSLSHVESPSTHIYLFLLDTQTLLHGHLPRVLHSYIIDNSLTTRSLSDFTTYCPYGVQLRLHLKKTFPSTSFAFSKSHTQLNPSSLGLSPKYFNVPLSFQLTSN